MITKQQLLSDKRHAKKLVYAAVKNKYGVSVLGLKMKDIIRIFAEKNNLTIHGNAIDWIASLYRLGTHEFIKKGAYKKVGIIPKKKLSAIFQKKRNDYNVFLRSAYWKKVRLLVLERDNKTCQVCGSKKTLHVHHKTYEHHFSELEHLEDLITLCKSCHEKEHNIKPKK